jgi:hypothetical protein
MTKSKYCEGERCGMCWRQENRLVSATHKIEEVIFDDDPNPNRHPFSQYVCDKHFNSIFGNISNDFFKPITYK